MFLMRFDVFMIGLRNVIGAQGGVESHVRNLSHELDKLGLQVAVSVRSPYSQKGDAMLGSNVKLVRIWSPRSVNTEALVHTFISICYAAITRPRLVHIHAVGPSVLVPLARLLGLRVVTTHHGEDYLREKWGWFARLLMRSGEYFQAALSERTICVSRSLSERLTRKYRRNFTYIPNGVIKNESGDPTTVLTDLGLRAGEYIVTVSRLVPEKRHLDLIEAFSRIQIPNLKLVIVGAADHRSAYSSSVMSRSYEVPGLVIAGFRTGAELRDLVQESGVFVLPSSHEGLPIALLEAMSFGCRIVVSDISPHLDLELPQENYHKTFDASDLAQKIAWQIAKFDGTRVDWNEKLQQYRWDLIAARVSKLYKDIDPRIGTTRADPAIDESIVM